MFKKIDKQWEIMREGIDASNALYDSGARALRCKILVKRLDKNWFQFSITDDNGREIQVATSRMEAGDEIQILALNISMSKPEDKE